MSRFVYDVDKITRYIDIHKQFQGGLKTVDTDDALRDVYLREAENVSLSEFNFIEKRYGLHKLLEHAPWASLSSVSSIVQGYFEYYVNANTVHKIIVIEGKFYIDQGAGFQLLNTFSVENGITTDLSSIGIDIAPNLSSATTFNFNKLFRIFDDPKQENVFNRPKIPWYSNITPNGVITGNKGDFIEYVLGSTSIMYYCEGGTSWYIYEAAKSFTTPAFVNGTIYKQSQTSVNGVVKTVYYQWNNPTGYMGKMTLLKDNYEVSCQSTRPVNGVRVDDKLYIATGTYPVYYKGDGKIYVLPQYEMSDLDIQKLGYNLNSVSIEDELYQVPILSEFSSSGDTYLNNPVEVGSAVFKEYKRYPKVPYQLNGGKITFESAYHLYNNAANTYWTSGVNLYNSDVTPATWNNPLAKWTLSSGVYTINAIRRDLRVGIKVYKKPSGTVPSFYEETEANVIFSRTISGSTYTGAFFSNNFTDYPEDFSPGVNYLLFPTASTSNDNGSTVSNISGILNNLKVEILEPNTGYWDYKIELYGQEITYRYARDTNGEEDRTKLPVLHTEYTPLSNFEFTDIWITPEKLEDFKDEPLSGILKATYACNQIIEHNGRLGLFGNPSFPDRLFFSTIGAKEYFPYFYSLQFSNELQEPITAISRFMNILVVQTPSYTFGLKGDSPLPLSDLEGQIYQKITINPTIGCIAPYSVKNVRNQLYFLSKEGIFTLRALYAEDNRYNVDPIDRNIYNIVPRDTNAVCAYFDDQYWLHFPTTGETLRYYVDKKAWVKDLYAPWNDFGGVFKYINESGKLRFITQLSQLEVGDPVKIFDIEVDYSLPTDLTKDITSKFTTSYLNQNQPFHPKNYKEAKFDFAIQNEYNTAMANLPVANYAETINYVQFTVDLLDRHFYSITFEPTEIGARPAAYTVEVDAVQVASGNITESAGNLSTIRFMSNKTGNVTVKITVTGKIITGTMSVDSIKLYDSTYDHTVTFNTIVLSEEGTLNIDPIDSYVAADVEVPIDLGTRTGNWTFGTSNFGNVIVAVKTVKLAGRGYNSKVSVIEDSKSKWTLESLGITYKMKKARSR